MRLILTKDVRKLGSAGDVVEVSDGFARNFLLAQKLAKQADAKALAEAEARKRHTAQKLEQTWLGAKKIMAKLGSAVYEFTLPGDAEGHLYASLKESEILARISGGGVAPVKLQGYAPLKRAGTYEIAVSGPEGLSGKVKITIICQK